MVGFGHSWEPRTKLAASGEKPILRKSESCPTEVNWQLAPTQMVRRVFLFRVGGISATTALALAADLARFVIFALVDEP